MAGDGVGAAAQDHPGAAPYREVCQLCHGVAGRGDIAPPLVPLGFDADYVLAVVREGYGQMPPISTRELNDDQVRQAVGYLASLGAAPEPPPQAAGSAYDGPRTPEGQPDLNGIWQVVNAAAWVIRPHNAQDGVPAGLGVVDDGGIPYQAWAAEQQEANYANRFEADPVRQCFLPGVPRITYMRSRSASFRHPTTSSSPTSSRTRRASSTRTAARIRFPTTSGWATRAATGRATRWSSTPPTSTGGPGSTPPATSTATRCTSWSATRRSLRTTSTTR